MINELNNQTISDVGVFFGKLIGLWNAGNLEELSRLYHEHATLKTKDITCEGIQEIMSRYHLHRDIYSSRLEELTIHETNARTWPNGTEGVIACVSYTAVFVEQHVYFAPPGKSPVVREPEERVRVHSILSLIKTDNGMVVSREFVL